MISIDLVNICPANAIYNHELKPSKVKSPPLSSPSSTAAVANSPASNRCLMSLRRAFLMLSALVDRPPLFPAGRSYSTCN